MSQTLQRLLDFVSLSPAIGLLKLASDAALADLAIPEETLLAMRQLVSDNALNELDPRAAWPLLERGLMGSRPSRMLAALDACEALPRLLPEVAALSGSYVIGPDDEAVDLAAHLGRTLDLAATHGAALRVRVAALLCHLGKSDSPPQHLPSHYRHIDRCLPRIAAIAQRFGLAPELQDFSVLATQEMERVHRAARMRADAVTALLERVDAFEQRPRFDDLLSLCACDWAAYPGQLTRPYPKAPLLHQALAACLAAGTVPPDDTDLHTHRTLAVAAALRANTTPDFS